MLGTVLGTENTARTTRRSFCFRAYILEVVTVDYKKVIEQLYKIISYSDKY